MCLDVSSCCLAVGLDIKRGFVADPRRCAAALQLVSKDVFLKLRTQAEQRRMGRWDKIVWHIENEDELLDPKTKSLKLVEGR
jgi:proteasome assembly chaperone (PAC2) family protein